MTPHPAAADQTAVEVDSLDFCYGSKQSLFNVTMKVPRNRVTAFIGPSGCGKSTLLRCINRMNDRIPEARVTGGSIRIDGVDVTSPSLDTIRLRREVGMVFQKSNPFPMSIYENVAYGLKLAGVKKRGILDEAVEESLRHAALWDEVKDRLHASANGLSGGQQQRLCIARSIAVKPRILLMDDVISTGGSIHAMEELVKLAGGIVAGRVSVLAEGDAAARKDIKFLAPLPVFNADGSVK